MSKTHFFYFFLFLLIASCKTKKNQLLQAYPEQPAKQVSFEFPLDWIGKYEGELIIINRKSDTSVVDMTLTIDYPNAEGYYPWVLSYGEDDKRYYGLEALNPELGHYRIDEFNSIKLDGFAFGNHFVVQFEVSGSELLVDYEKTNVGINLTFVVSPSRILNTTGGEIFGTDTIPSVNSYAPSAYQFAQLIKVE